MHRCGRHHACTDQCLRALLAFGQDDRVGRHHPGLVVQGARLGRCHLATLGIPGPELLLAPGRVVAVDDRDQLPCGIEVVPLGGGRTEVIDRRFLLYLARRRGWSKADQITGMLQHLRKIVQHVDAEIGSNQIEDVPAITCRAISPQASLIAIEHHLEAVPRAAQHIADQELAPALLACGEQVEEHRLQSRQQVGAHGIALCADIHGCFSGVVVEIKHRRPPGCSLWLRLAGTPSKPSARPV